MKTQKESFVFGKYTPEPVSAAGRWPEGTCEDCGAQGPTLLCKPRKLCSPCGVPVLLAEMERKYGAAYGQHP